MAKAEEQARVLQKKVLQKNVPEKFSKKNLLPQFANFSQNSCVKILFRTLFVLLQDKNTLFMTFAHFQKVKKYCCPLAEDKTFSMTCRIRGRGQGLDLRGQSPKLQIVSSRPRTFSRTPPPLAGNKAFLFVTKLCIQSLSKIS